MAVKVMSGIQAAVEGVKLTVKHVTGAVGSRMVKGQEEAVGIGTQVEDGFQGRARHMGLSPSLEFSDLGQEVGGLGCVIDVPDTLLDGLKGAFEALAAGADGEEGMQKAQASG
jgi:hypothetical protein